MNSMHKRISAAAKRIPADLVIKNARVVDVFNLGILEADVAVCDGYIVGLGEYQGLRTLDAGGRYVCPGLIDSHVHIETAFVTPREMAKVLLPHGVTTIVADPHEICNVSGSKGIDFILEDSEGIPLDVMVMLPSCVPAIPSENSGAVMHSEDLSGYYGHPRVLGLAEVMDFPSVRDTAPDMMAKLGDAESHNKVIDGHGVGLDEVGVNIYRTANILTDHESTTKQEVKDRIERGMYIPIREGTIAKNLVELLPMVSASNARRFCFCTDDKHIDDLLAEGSIDYSIRLAIREGMSPLQAIQLGTLNAAECHRISGKGAIAPGYKADFLLVDSLDSFEIHQVYKGGELVAEAGKVVCHIPPSAGIDADLLSTVNAPSIAAADIQIPMGSGPANIIGVLPNSLITKHLLEDVDTRDGYFVPSGDRLKLVVVERHKNLGNIGLGIAKGFGLGRGAIATTVSHDSHNIVATGTSDADILLAINTLKDMGGGVALVMDDEVLATLALPIAGIITDKPYQEVAKSLGHIEAALSKMGFGGDFDPILTLSFLALPVIPALKLTDAGLFDVTKFEKIGVQNN